MIGGLFEPMEGKDPEEKVAPGVECEGIVVDAARLISPMRPISTASKILSKM